jgi:tRNA U55 pseudouridine synthase TruB
MCLLESTYFVKVKPVHGFLLLNNFLGMWPRVHPKSLKVGHGGTLDHTATGILGTEPL